MKGVQGLVLAIGLGVVGAFFNWMYLHSGPSRDEMISFIGIAREKPLMRGDILHETDLVEVPVPAKWVGSLSDFAIGYNARKSVIGQPVTRNLAGGCLLFREDLETPREELNLGPDERAMWIPVETRAFVPSLVKPGDSVSFFVSRPSGAATAPVGPGGRGTSEKASSINTIGPFTILALGNRLGRLDVMRAAKMSPVQENVIAIRVSSRVPGEVEKAEELWALLQATNFRQVGIMLHGKSAEKP